MNRRQFITRSAAATVASAGYLSAQQSLFAGKDRTAKVRVGFIGTAHPHAQGKMAAIRDLQDTFELVGVVEPNAVLREACKSKPEYQDLKWLDSDQLFATDGLEAVIVETDFPDLLPT